MIESCQYVIQHFRGCPIAENRMKGYHFDVYNRWGEIVFQTQDPTECWHGNSNVNEDSTMEDVGKAVVKDDVYVCLFRFLDPESGEKKSLTMHLTVIN